jgi:hypothetical protein
MKKSKTNTVVQTYEVLNSLTRDQLRNIAAHASVPRGRDKKNTAAHIVAAIRDGKLKFKSIVTISIPTENPFVNKTLLMKKFRSYKNDKVLADVPTPPVPVPVKVVAAASKGVPVVHK